MRSIVVVITVFICSVMCVLSVLTIDSFTLQKDELERALDFATEQAIHRCIEDGITDADEVAFVAIEAFRSQINSDKGNLVLYVLHADENIVDLAVSFTYTQYNGTKKEIVNRKTAIKDWENDDLHPVVRLINEKYIDESPERGGLKENSVWRFNNTLKNVLSNKQVDGVWLNVQQAVTIKTGE